jgi:Mrp family chromosome partitioning ATPase
MAARARNAMRRGALIGAVATLGFLAALVALVLIPREARRAARMVAPRPEERPDTAAILARLSATRLELAAAESALAAARATAVRPPPPPPPTDTLSPALIARRDTLRTQLETLEPLLARASSAPLPASYRALGDVLVMRGDPLVRALLDTLAEVERDREAIGAIGGVDPIFVALTSRVNALGRSIVAVGEERQRALRAELAALAPPAPPPRAPEVVVRVDTLPRVVARDAAVARLASTLREIAEARLRIRQLQAREAQARELANIAAPPLARLLAALILGLAVGFAAALAAEVRRPRIADAREAERVSGARVLARIRPEPPLPERSRRRADLEAPRLIDPSGESYRLLYLHLAAAGATLPFVTVTGDDPETTAVVAANLAARAAADARSTLVVDGDLEGALLGRVLRVRTAPGLAQVMAGTASWAEAITQALVGRDRTVDVMTTGRTEPATVPGDLVPVVRHDLGRLTRRYDVLILLTGAEHVLAGASSILPAPDVIYVARTGQTRLRQLADHVQGFRAAGTRVCGVVLWDAEPPVVPPALDQLAEAGVLPTADVPAPVR